MRYAAAAFILMGLVVPTCPAIADARDTVLLNLARCGAIADARTWLDCYYGAAQPMRGQLGLPPAPESQTRLSGGGAPAPNITPAPQPGGANTQIASAPAPRRSSGGFFTNLLGGTPVLSNIAVSSYAFDHGGFITVTLANGQTWQQESADSSFAQWRGPASHYVVSISKGALGSFNMQAAGDNKLYKVHRIR